jgi:alpha-L-arabinofuranosidase
MNVQGELKILTKQSGPVLGDLFGIFFEDLNHAADGGLYAELVRNRSFEFDPIDNADFHSLTAWSEVLRSGKAEIKVEDDYPLNARNPHYLSIQILDAGNGVGIKNEGYAGIHIRKGESYQFSFYARRSESFDTPVIVSLESADGKVYGTTEIIVHSDQWTKYEAGILANGDDNSGRLVIVTRGTGTLFLDMVSLFPEKTFNNRPNGLRADIAQLIADMKPKFMRFPGGCLVHDGSLNPDDRNSMYRWKNTIGDVAERPSRRNNWKYNQTLGLGYYELFQFCEDIGAKPLPVLPAGVDPHHKRIVPIDELQPWIDDALDLIEFANGEVTTPWGAVRAELGHPEPFHLEYIGIGNEEVDIEFFERYRYFHNAIKEKYPEMKVISSSGPNSDGADYDRGWAESIKAKADLVDEHYYKAPDWFLVNYNRYDHFDRTGPKVFVGEYASRDNKFYNALIEAAYMTGLEKNADVVNLACYAPMLANADFVNWQPDLIWYNNHSVYGTPNYYVQKMFMNHQGDVVLPSQYTDFEEKQQIAPSPISGKVGISTRQVKAEFSDVILTNNETGETLVKSNFENGDLSQWQITGGEWNCSGNKLVQNDDTVDGYAVIGDKDWHNYTLTMKVKRISGTHGMVIIFGWQDDQNHSYWDFGGYMNGSSYIMVRKDGSGSSHMENYHLSAENHREYSIKVEVTGRHIRCYLDGELVHEFEDRLPDIQSVYHSSSRDHATGDMIIKAVNVLDRDVTANIVLEDAPDVHPVATLTQLTASHIQARNSFENPEMVKPIEKEITGVSSEFIYKFPAYSITIFRIKQGHRV